jgi:hypothetical protein
LVQQTWLLRPAWRLLQPSQRPQLLLHLCLPKHRPLAR